MSPTSGHPSGGEPIDRAAGEAIRLAHRALDRFPEVVRRHKFVAGGAVISSSLIALAGVAIARRIRAGQTPDEAVANVTAEEVQGFRIIEPAPATAEDTDGGDTDAGVETGADAGEAGHHEETAEAARQPA